MILHQGGQALGFVKVNTVNIGLKLWSEMFYGHTEVSWQQFQSIFAVFEDSYIGQIVIFYI